ncbi:MAG: hypothetical protein NE334_20295 [Lentisphaeraceae bacterium]|nr:hypothetical protein [Lentisphaeraceae bacterium]
MNSKLCLNYSISLESCTLNNITALLKELLPLILEDIFCLILFEFGDIYKNDSTCDCSVNSRLKWSHKVGRKSNIKTQWGDVKIPQLQTQCTTCGQKKSIARSLLGMKPRTQIGQSLKETVSLFNALMPYRVCAKVLKFTGIKMSQTQAWRCTQEVGNSLKFDLDQDACKSGMADGTEIGIQGIKKRGRELKVFAQNKPNGKLHIAGINIGKYESEDNWREIFEPLKESFEQMGHFRLSIDGDCAILKGFDANIDLHIQRCLWHIPHQFKHYLWMDGVKRKSRLWRKIMARCLRFVSLPKSIIDDTELVEQMLKDKEVEYQELIKLLEKHKCKSCLSHLQNAYPNMFTNFSNQWSGKTTSLIERIMRTVNLRVNVGKWSTKGVLNTMKIRLAYYYNGFNPQFKHQSVRVSRLITNST